MAGSQNNTDAMIVNEVPVPVDLPQMVTVHQRFDRTAVPDIEAAVRGQLAQSSLRNVLTPGSRIAVTAGIR